jgi:hypothetical protein
MPRSEAARADGRHSLIRRGLLGTLMVAVLAMPPAMAWAGASAAGPAAIGVPDQRLALLRRGVNVTGWFRFPVSQDPAALRRYLAPGAIEGLRQAGFTFVRLPVDPALLANPAILPVLVEQIRRLRDAGLGVVVSVHPTGWHLESREADRAALHVAWRRLGPLLAPLGGDRVFPEPLNEPVFPGDPAGWQRLQRAILATLRASLPGHTIILTGHDWSSIAGLAALTPEPDRNVVYTFHLYEPSDLTSLAAWRQGLDRVALARLPFPVDDPADCARIGASTTEPTAGMIRFYCAQRWDEAAIGARVNTAAAWARRHGVALLAGEFGASLALNARARLNWLRAVRTACEAAGIGWALWGYDDVMGFGLSRPPGPTPVLNGAMLRALGLRE